MLQYLQSWFPGWGGWYGQQTPEGRAVEGLPVEQQEQWNPEEILGMLGGGLILPLAVVKGDARFIKMGSLFVQWPLVIFKFNQRRHLENHLFHVHRGRENTCFGRDSIATSC